ncbi:MAG: hypothetical protein K8F91_01350, partial [Candidatus Obscuribacterales bacterium]|nr:hypothetical protein [Candidatus Obscuribacterales bacterium]
TIAAQAAALGIDTAAYLERRDTALGIDTSPYFKHREAALPGLAGLASRLAEGGSHPIDSTEAAAIESVFTETMRIKSELQSLVFHYHHYQEMFATHQKQESELADRVRKLRYADGALDNRIADAYIVYAANPEPVLAQSKAAFEEVFQAVKRGDLKAAHQAANQARSFSTREHFLGVLLRNGTLTAAN